MIRDLYTATSHLREFSKTWNDGDCVDEGSKLTGADLATILDALDQRRDEAPERMVSSTPLP